MLRELESVLDDTRQLKKQMSQIHKMLQQQFTSAGDNPPPDSLKILPIRNEDDLRLVERSLGVEEDFRGFV